MSYIDLIKQIKKGSVSPLYLLAGTEEYLIEDTLHRIIERTLSEEEKEFNLSKFDMKEYSVDVAIEEAYTFPFMGGKRIVILKDAYFFTSAKESGKVEHNLKKLEAYMESPAPETVFIIQAPYEKLDERKKIVKLAKKNGEYLDGCALDERELYQWLIDRGHDHHVEFDKPAAELLISLTGGQLMLLASEIKKLAIHTGEGGTVTETIVQSLVPRSLEQNIFSLVDGVVKRDISKSWKIYLDLLKQKEEPLKIIALMVRQFRILFQVKQLTGQGYGQKQIAANLKLHPYAVKLAMGQAKQFKDEELLDLLDQLADIDYNIKTGRMDKSLAVEIFFSKRAKIYT
ncbi:DNA polymerase III, delta subunit [Evansella caseinilytica]|uniref:DNA polymerase III subunit delta n=1 Tax=Evansella caseinilytica TaxID=1503961 RepID=A0A1H3KFV3_9BACI|nr:DNA polymerase III subunit delta [Evansella caseinilytica]SDY50986.1 DNA polymerase III, delta subunit [Evansella caseinilytica]